MTRKRAHISWKTKYASALLALGDIPYSDGKLMSEDQVISLYQVDHNHLHSFGGSDKFWNLTPMLRGEHREKSRRDTSIVAKSKRISTAHEDFRRRILAIEKRPRERSNRWASGKLRSRNDFRRGKP